jgi:YD repeat-containing protein
MPDNTTIRFQYDANGNRTVVRPAGRQGHAFGYTPVDLTGSYTPPAVPGAGPTQYRWNRDRQLTAIDRPDGLATAVGYDNGARLGKVAFSRGELQFTYDTAGRLERLSDPGGVNLTFAYDGSLPLSESWSGPVTGSVSRTFNVDFLVDAEQVSGAFPVTFGYDDDGLVTRAGDLALGRDAANGFVTETALEQTTDSFTYDEFGEPSRYMARHGVDEVFDVRYTRDALGRITRRIEVIDGLTRVFEYGYDAAGRLQVIRRDGTLVVMYTYDENGNRIQAEGEQGLVTATYDEQDRLLTYGNGTYAFGANGELISRTVAGATTSYEYDTLGNLIRVVRPDGTIVAYTVDGRGRRVRKSIDGVAVQGWLYADQLRPIAELDGSGAIVSRFVYGSRSNVPDYLVKNGVTYRIFVDHVGSPRIVMNAATGEVA